MGTADTTITAHYTQIGFTLTVNANGGLWDGISPQALAVNGIAIIGEPIKVGHVFNGWTVNGEGSSFNEATKEFTMGSENATITANWFLKEKELAYIPPIDNTDSPYHLFTVPATGWYQIEVWGAGGGINNSNPSAGGYSSGKIQLTEGEKLYIYVGGKGISCSTAGACLASGGYNGGGYAFYNTNNSSGGGGGTDVRIFENVPTDFQLGWNSAIGLNSRIMVAGGGGGNGTSDSPSGYKPGYGGHGGNLIGTTGKDDIGYTTYWGTGGMQIMGGTTYYSSGASALGKGSFGQGGFHNVLIECCGNNGGGGGYYGGGASSRGHGGGGGGSSYISGYGGVVSVESASDETEPRLHPNNTTKHYSGKYFIDGKMQSGVNEENGKAKITFIGFNKPERINPKLNNVRYIEDCATGNAFHGYIHWDEIQAIVNGINVAYGKTIIDVTVPEGATTSYTRITDGIMGTDTSFGVTSTNSQGTKRCVTVDLGATYELDEIMVLHLASEIYHTYQPHYNNVTRVSSDKLNWIEAIKTGDVSETSSGKRVSAYSID